MDKARLRDYESYFKGNLNVLSMPQEAVKFGLELIAALREAWRERDAARNNQFEQREHWRKESHDLLARRGLQPNDLQWKWRGETAGGKTPTQYDTQEVCEAIFDALIEQGGYPCWIGDGISCVEQIVRAQAQRAARAEAEVERLMNMINDGPYVPKIVKLEAVREAAEAYLAEMDAPPNPKERGQTTPTDWDIRLGKKEQILRRVLDVAQDPAR